MIGWSPLFLLDGVEVVRPFLLSSATNKMINESSAQLLKGGDRTWLQIGIPVPSHPLQDRGKCLAQDSISRSMEEHHCLKALQMVDEICRPVVVFELRNLEVAR